ncbi:hypothetical protein Gotri_026350 [Gossypium trilobum]|uniref:Uncharacterized protein n=1 Tax=Gossypium trilobum TaxID=34281 RepID=A0A7J9FUQ5_9ROSI|nr:hypothetical protein [Gossypium trilobum]
MKRFAVGPMEIQEEKTKADQWEKKFQDTRAREVALEKSLLEYRNKKVGLKARVTELEKSLHQHCSRNSVIELKASLSKIEELKESLKTRLEKKTILWARRWLKYAK